MTRFEELLSLQPNWDSYGAKCIDGACVDKAEELYYRLLGVWAVVPCPDGGVQLEQHADGFDIELTITRAAVTR